MSITYLTRTEGRPKMSKSKMNVREALRRARESETDHVDADTESVLTTELARIWSSIQAEPDTYTMDLTEFGVFNRYRGQQRFQNETARKAVERYWNSKTETNSH